MTFFDFHHHTVSLKNGIYNLKYGEGIPETLFSAGIHPNSIGSDLEEKFIWLEEVSTLKNCVAIGECGLDSLLDIEDQLQDDVFERQIHLANKLQKPVIIHCVNRFHRLDSFQKISKVPLIIHGFNKRKTIGEVLQNQNFFLSFGKSVLYNVNLQEFLRDFPLEKLFLETDSADFDLAELYFKVASVKNISVETLLEKIAENLQTLKISF